jgi:hypothetical protein
MLRRQIEKLEAQTPEQFAVIDRFDDACMKAMAEGNMRFTIQRWISCSRKLEQAGGKHLTIMCLIAPVIHDASPPWTISSAK